MICKSARVVTKKNEPLLVILQKKLVQHLCAEKQKKPHIKWLLLQKSSTTIITTREGLTGEGERGGPHRLISRGEQLLHQLAMVILLAPSVNQ